MPVKADIFVTEKPTEESLAMMVSPMNAPNNSDCEHHR